MEQENIFRYKSYLFTIAYNLTGDTMVSEDLVQDTFEMWLSGDRSDVRDCKAYLSRIIVNKSIDRLDRQKKERSLYKGVWLPEPVIGEVSSFQPQEDMLDYAFLFLIDKLNPFERAVLVLREVFDYPYHEIADFLGHSEENCRQILHRAKEKVRVSRMKTKREDEGRHKKLLEAFLAAIYRNDAESLQSLLKEDIMLYSDGGGKVAAALKPLAGIPKVIRFLIGVNNLNKGSDFDLKEVRINGGPAIILFMNGAFHSFVWVDTDGDRISNIFLIRNPDKIKI